MDVAVTTADDEALLLALLNTTPVIDGSPTDTLADFSAAAEWMSERGIPAHRSQWAALIEAREVLQAVTRGDRPPSMLETIVVGTQLVPTFSEDGIDWQLTVDGPTSGAVRAALAWDGLRINSPGRLRPCANTECHLFLIDRSKPNTARWCSMAVCGNRMKARRHYSRTSAERG
ncbi:MAG: CGNR zinc finger domain-containing protein [Mycobacterium sp.]